MENFDLIVVGGGKAGKSLAMNRAKHGWKVALIERQFIGGTCINVACIPTKSLVASARRLDEARNDSVFGVEGTGNVHIDIEKLRAHKNGIVSAMIAAHEKFFAAPGIDFMRGSARLLDAHSVEVTLEDGTARQLHSDKVLLNLGTRPAHPPIPGLWEAGAWDSEDILRLEEIPSSLAIIGGGYIGVEFASMMATFGSQVTVIASGEHILDREDPDIAAIYQEVLSTQGVTVLTGARAQSAAKDGNNIRIELSDGREVTAERVLVAAGRVPNTDGIGLAEAGIRLSERGFIEVDDHLRTPVEGVWAAGDCAGTPMFTHASWNDYRIIREQLDGVSLDDPRTSKAGRVIPWALFAHPELGRIGINETEAAQRGLEVLVASIDTAAIPRAKTMRDTTGKWKAIVDAHTHKILGATLVGPQSGEVITAVQVAMEAGLTYEQLRMLPIAHPTMGEGLNILFDSLA